MVEVSFDRKSLIIEGQRRLVISGSIQYYRWPAVAMWRPRLRALKKMGLDAIDVYFYWGYHSAAPGQYDFTEGRDVDLLMDLIEEEGFYLMARPGPYICSEVDGGGFPAWLLKEKKLNLRCKKDGKFVYDAEYLKYVREWYEQIVPRIAKRKNLILFQIENEYHFLPTPKGAWLGLQKWLQSRRGANAIFNLQMKPGVKKILLWAQRRAMHRPGYVQTNRYMKELYQAARELGITVPIFHNDLEGARQRFTDVDVVGIDDYPIKTFEKDWRGNPGVFGTLDLLEEGHAAHGQACPLLIGELQGGWYDPWGGRGYPESRRRLGVDSLDLSLKTALSQGAGVINLFMAAGGTSIGYLASPDVYTSYDFAAPITEGGRPSARARGARKFISFAHRHEAELIESIPGPPLCELSPELYCRARHAPSGERFIFLRNCTNSPKAAQVGETRVSLNPSSMTVILASPQNQVLDRLDPMVDAGGFVFPKTDFPHLEKWKFGMVSQPLSPEFDDRDWIKVPARAPLDLDSLGFHYGFAWYRGHLPRRIKSFRLDARHCFAAYLNGHLLAAVDNHRNRLAAGDDMAETITVHTPEEYYYEKNVLCILVESLGHNKGFLEDLHNPRGIVAIDLDGVSEWRVRGGLVPGETGMTPRVDFGKVEVELMEEVETPHVWTPGLQGVGLYQTTFRLDLAGPDEPTVGLHLPQASEKANIYLNGWLIGRYWGEVGPQNVFYLPAGLLHHQGENHLALALWRWREPGQIGRVHLELYP